MSYEHFKAKKKEHIRIIMEMFSHSVERKQPNKVHMTMGYAICAFNEGYIDALQLNIINITRTMLDTFGDIMTPEEVKELLEKTREVLSV